MDQQKAKKKSIPKPTHFGKNLKFLRRINGLSQQELAKKLGMNRNNIASYEASSSEPSALVFLKISKFFNQDPAEMLELIMIDHKIENSQITVPSLEPLQQHQFEENLNQIIHDTNEMTKIFNGYTSLIEMKNRNKEDKVSVELYSSFTDILDLLQSLITLNWDFIQKTVPSQIQE